MSATEKIESLSSLQTHFNLILHHNTGGCSHFARNFATDLHNSGLLRVLRGAVFSGLGRGTRRGSGVAF